MSRTFEEVREEAMELTLEERSWLAEELWEKLAGTTGAASMGTSVTIQTDGPMIEPSWAWDVDKLVWLGLNGYLTQIPPTAGYLVQIGIPSSATVLIIQPQIVARLT